MTAGPPGAGKSAMVKTLDLGGPGWRVIDASKIKLRLLEEAVHDGVFGRILASGLADGHNIMPNEISSLVHNESVLLADPASLSGPWRRGKASSSKGHFPGRPAAGSLKITLTNRPSTCGAISHSRPKKRPFALLRRRLRSFGRRKSDESVWWLDTAEVSHVFYGVQSE